MIAGNAQFDVDAGEVTLLRRRWTSRCPLRPDSHQLSKTPDLPGLDLYATLATPTALVVNDGSLLTADHERASV